MFILRAFAAMLSLFAITYLSVSCIVLLLWQQVHRAFARRSSVALARGLYLVRIAPLLIAAAVALLYELPSFLRFEPAGVAEGLSPVTMSFSGLVLVASVMAAWHMRAACRRTDELCSTIARDASDAGPMLAVVGAIQQRVLISQKAAELLQQEELSRALAHETAHVRSRDNLRKLHE